MSEIDREKKKQISEDLAQFMKNREVQTFTKKLRWAYAFPSDLPGRGYLTIVLWLDYDTDVRCEVWAEGETYEKREIFKKLGMWWIERRWQRSFRDCTEAIEYAEIVAKESEADFLAYVPFIDLHEMMPRLSSE